MAPPHSAFLVLFIFLPTTAPVKEKRKQNTPCNNKTVIFSKMLFDRKPALEMMSNKTKTIKNHEVAINAHLKALLPTDDTS